MIARTIEQFFAPILVAFENRASAVVLLEDLGWTVDETFQIAALGPIQSVATGVEALAAEIARFETGQAEEGDVIEQAIILAETTFATITELQQMADDGGPYSLIAPLDTAVFWREFALDLPEYLILTYLRTYAPAVHAILDFGGCIGRKPRTGGRPPRETLDWAALGALFSDPAGHLTTEYNWGGALEHALMLKRLAGVLKALKVSSNFYRVPDAIAADRFGGTSAGVSALGAPVLERARSIRAAQFLASSPASPPMSLHASASLDAVIVPVPPAGQGGDPTGLLLTLQALGEIGIDFALGDGWHLTPSAALDASGLLGVEIQPTGVGLAAGSPAGEVMLELAAHRESDPMVLIGSETGTRIALGALAGTFGAKFQGGEAELLGALALGDLRLVIAPGEGDGFIADVLGETTFEVPLAFGLDWSSVHGLTLNGGAGVGFAIAINRRIGPLEIFDINVEVRAGSDGLSAGAGVAGSLVLGPFTATVDGVGFEIVVVPKPRGQSGTAGAVDLAVGFKPPTGIGLAIEAPGVTGGGYLDIDRALGRYFGILDIGLFGLRVTAVGLISTRLPDGSDGWSMYLSISVIFPGGIQLGFGFKLEGVGGLIAINRGVDIDALGDGVRTGALDAILFPEDAIANAPVILNTIETVFPQQPGQFAFGPVFRLAWGTPTIVTIDLGVVIQLPDPVTISLLGAIGIDVGKGDVTIVKLRIDVVGTLWPAEKRLAIDSSIREGQIAMLSLAGDMSVRLDFGASQPTFLVACGGFHPDFPQPEGFPTLARLALNIFDEEKLRVGVESYLAVTSNSLQFGVAAYFWAKSVGLTADGRFEFDTLIYLRPFGLTARLGFQVTVKAGSKELLQVTLCGTLTGPQPWVVSGYAEFKALGVKKKFRAEATLGRAVQAGPVEQVDVLGDVVAALLAPEAWRAGDLPAEVEAAVSVQPPEGVALIHPAGAVDMVQGVAPFGVRIEKVGAGVPADGPLTLAIGAVQFAGETALFSDVEDWFAPATFFEMEEDERVEAPSFELLPGGARIAEAGPVFAEARAAARGYETAIVDPDLEEDFTDPIFDLSKLKDGPARGILGNVLGPVDRPGPKIEPSGYGIRPLDYAVTDATGATGAPKRYAAALSEVRAAETKGGARGVIRPSYEIAFVGG